MYIAWFLAALASIAGFYLYSNENQSTIPTSVTSTYLAGNMGVYRSAVVSYAYANPSYNGTAPDSGLVSFYPLGYIALSPPQWTNYIAPDGTIIVYASALPSTSLISELGNISHNSRLAGQADTSSNVIIAPAYTDTPVPLPSYPGMVTPIPNGSPVWLAYRK